MALLWTSPRTFVSGKVLTASQLNEITNNLSYLYTRANKVVTIRGSGSNLTTASTTFVDVDAGGSLSFTLETSGGALECNLLGVFSNTSSNTMTCFDIYMDGTTYLSSLTGTALTNGIWQAREVSATYIESIKATPYRLEVGAVAAGVHTFVLRWRTSAGTATLYPSAGNLLQLSICETA